MTPEAEFVKLRARQARQRLRSATVELVDGVLGPFEVRPFVRERPWSSLGFGLVGGFLTGMALRRGARRGRNERAGLGRRLATMVNRARRLVTGAFGAIVAANLRELAGHGVPRTNGRAR